VSTSLIACTVIYRILEHPQSKLPVKAAVIFRAALARAAPARRPHPPSLTHSELTCEINSSIDVSPTVQRVAIEFNPTEPIDGSNLYPSLAHTSRRHTDVKHWLEESCSENYALISYDSLSYDMNIISYHDIISSATSSSLWIVPCMSRRVQCSDYTRHRNCHFLYIFTARRSYASAVLGVVILSVRPPVRPSVCLSVCLSVRHTRAL